MQRTSRATTTTGEKGPAPIEKKKRRKRRGMLGLPAGIPALIVLVGAVALGRMAADDYAEGPIQRVSVVAMVVSVPFCVWGLFNTMMYHLDLGMVSYALAGAAGAYGFGLLSVDGYEHSASNVRTVTFAGFGSVAANYLLGLAVVPTFSGLGLYFVVALAFWASMLYSAYAATSVELDPSSTYTSLI